MDRVIRLIVAAGVTMLVAALLVGVIAGDVYSAPLIPWGLVGWALAAMGMGLLVGAALSVGPNRP